MAVPLSGVERKVMSWLRGYADKAGVVSQNRFCYPGCEYQEIQRGMALLLTPETAPKERSRLFPQATAGNSGGYLRLLAAMWDGMYPQRYCNGKKARRSRFLAVSVKLHAVLNNLVLQEFLSSGDQRTGQLVVLNLPRWQAWLTESMAPLRARQQTRKPRLTIKQVQPEEIQILCDAVKDAAEPAGVLDLALIAGANQAYPRWLNADQIQALLDNLPHRQATIYYPELPPYREGSSNKPRTVWVFEARALARLFQLLGLPTPERYWRTLDEGVVEMLPLEPCLAPEAANPEVIQ